MADPDEAAQRWVQRRLAAGDEAYERLSTLTIGQLSSVTNRKTRDLDEGPAVKPRKVISDEDRKALAEALGVILEGE